MHGLLQAEAKDACTSTFGVRAWLNVWQNLTGRSLNSVLAKVSVAPAARASRAAAAITFVTTAQTCGDVVDSRRAAPPPSPSTGAGRKYAVISSSIVSAARAIASWLTPSTFTVIMCVNAYSLSTLLRDCFFVARWPVWNPQRCVCIYPSKSRKKKNGPLRTRALVSTYLFLHAHGMTTPRPSLSQP